MAKVFGLDFGELHEGDMPVEGMILMRVMDKDGDTSVIQLFSEGFDDPHLALGMLIAASDITRRELLDMFSEDEG